MKKVLVVTLATTLAFTSVAPIVSQAKTDTEINEYKQQEEQQTLEKELEKANITQDDIILGLQTELNKNYIEQEPQFATFGVKSQAAKVAGKAMLKKIKSIGSTAWNKTISEYVDKFQYLNS